MGQPEYAFDKTFCSAALLRALAEEYGTPLLVYDRETWLGRVKLLKEAFSWAPGFRQFFPVKAAGQSGFVAVGPSGRLRPSVQQRSGAVSGGSGWRNWAVAFVYLLFSRQGRLGGPSERPAPR